MIRIRGAEKIRGKMPIVPGEAFHAECKLLPGLSPFLKRRARVRVGDGGSDLVVFVDPEKLPRRNGRIYVQLYEDCGRKPTTSVVG